MALEEAYATMDFSVEKILYEGPPSTGDLITNVALGITVLWLVRHYPPTGIRLNANRLGFGTGRQKIHPSNEAQRTHLRGDRVRATIVFNFKESSGCGEMPAKSML